MPCDDLRLAALPDTATGVVVGDLRVAFPWLGCGTCARCLAGEDSVCATPSSIGVMRHGGYAERVVVPHQRYLVDLGTVDPARADDFEYEGRPYRSLSAIARRITGTRWNGWTFFGLKGRPGA